jgi:hypothetical protein
VQWIGKVKAGKFIDRTYDIENDTEDRVLELMELCKQK